MVLTFLSFGRKYIFAASIKSKLMPTLQVVLEMKESFMSENAIVFVLVC